jgi:hypothetical protein
MSNTIKHDALTLACDDLRRALTLAKRRDIQRRDMSDRWEAFRASMRVRSSVARSGTR